MTTTDQRSERALARATSRVHPAWWVAGVTFLTIIGAAGFRSTPGIMMNPLHDEFGWPMGVIGGAVSVNLVLYGLVAPFSAALMERLGVTATCRASFAMYSTKAEVDALVEALVKAHEFFA